MTHIFFIPIRYDVIIWHEEKFLLFHPQYGKFSVLDERRGPRRQWHEDIAHLYLSWLIALDSLRVSFFRHLRQTQMLAYALVVQELKNSAHAFVVKFLLNLNVLYHSSILTFNVFEDDFCTFEYQREHSLTILLNYGVWTFKNYSHWLIDFG